MNRKYGIAFVLMFATLQLPTASNAGDDKVAEMTPIGPEAFKILRRFFDYDEAVPLNARVVERLEGDGYTREKIVLSASRYSEVPGYLGIPKNGTAPYPCVLLLHGLTSSKEDWWDGQDGMAQLTRQLLASGYAVLSLDVEYHGERTVNNELESVLSLFEKGWFVRSRDMMIQSTIEYRRAIDFLATRKQIDVSRIGAVGYSMGGVMTFNLTAVDSRIKAAVSCVSPIITVPYLPTNVHYSAPYISKRPFLMLMGKNDERNYTVAAAEKLYELTGSETKELVFYDSGHNLPGQWADRAADWIKEYL